MADKNSRRNQTTDALFDAILSLESREECYAFFEDLCTVKEISDMAQRLQAAKLLLDGATYEQIVKAVEISTARTEYSARYYFSTSKCESQDLWVNGFQLMCYSVLFSSHMKENHLKIIPRKWLELAHPLNL